MRKLIIIFIIIGAVAVTGVAAFALYYYPTYITPKLEYQKAEALFDEGSYVSAALHFSSMNGYGESNEYTQKAWIAAGDEAMADGKLAQAALYYKNGMAGSEYLKRVDSAYYESGVEYYSQGNIAYAEAEFAGISQASELLLLIDNIRIEYASDCIERDDYAAADKAFAMCNESAGDTIADIWYASGTAKLSLWELTEAASCFSKALAYTNTTESLIQAVEASWKQAGDSAVAAKNYDLAERCYAHSGLVYDADESRKSNAYQAAAATYASGYYVEALRQFMALGDYSDSEQRAAGIQQMLRNRLVAGGSVFFATLEFDGSVSLYGDWEDYSAPNWTELAALAVGRYRFMIGLRSNGTVVGSGNNAWGNLEISGWSNIVQVACGYRHVLGLKEDGTVVGSGSDIYGQRSHPQLWSRIVQLACGDAFSVGLRADGSVVAAGQNNYGQCNTGFMENVVQIGCGAAHVAALKSDGTVYATGLNSSGQCNVGRWTDIVEIYVGTTHTVGVKSDGTLVATGSNTYGECNVGQYRDVLYVSCGANFTLIMLKDGTEIRIGAINNVD